MLRLAARHLYCSPTTPFSRFRLLPFHSPLIRESLLLYFPLATKMFQFARLSLACPWIQQQFERLTYSGISGSMLIFNSPRHFVTYYALLRLWVPRYPPILVVPEDPATGEPGTESFPPFPSTLWPSSTLTAQPESRQLMRLKGDSASSCSQGPTLSYSPGIPDKGTLGEPSTTTTVHGRSILDLTNCPSYLLYVLDNPSLSQ
ncbi:hypothetical protein E3N88_18437 [Mikania micrantha]|uniref:Uncharacterized protein n=1 Tax=Mikania micrantha TaxID=192012 RepID=A0A5N6NKD7_9ASTR|nr:hypothetical protein E3N88_18437 [Mikania micrantha]